MKYAQLFKILSKYQEFKIVINDRLFRDFHKENSSDYFGFLPGLNEKVYEHDEKIAYDQFAFLDRKFVCDGFDDKKIYSLKDLERIVKQHKALLNFQ